MIVICTRRSIAWPSAHPTPASNPPLYSGQPVKDHGPLPSVKTDLGGEGQHSYLGPTALLPISLPAVEQLPPLSPIEPHSNESDESVEEAASAKASAAIGAVSACA